METVKFVNDYVKLARQKHNKKFFTIKDGHILECMNWCREDIIQQADDIKLSDAEIDYILYRMVDNHDAELGINWGIIDCYIDEIIDAREKGGTL